MGLDPSVAARELLRRRDGLLATYRRTVRAERAREEQEPEFVETAQLHQDDDLLRRLEDSERAAVREIDVALARIAEGTWGRCIDCNRRIQAKRLMAKPEAARCWSCAEARETRR